MYEELHYSKHIVYYLFIQRHWLFDHLTPSFLAPTQDILSLVFIESIALELMITIHSGMTAKWAGLFNSQAKPVEVNFRRVRWFGERGQQTRLSPDASK
ncbi:hypothetical protein TNCV_619111 [Trichonephila clavipes]|nr:hypothetical protein TNCV_619111 [Trichonephila clavipes]